MDTLFVHALVAPALHAAHIWILFHDHTTMSFVSQPVAFVLDDPIPFQVTEIVAPLHVNA